MLDQGYFMDLVKDHIQLDENTHKNDGKMPLSIAARFKQFL